ncbi:hypothetical protein [Pseudomonas leptonychotis]|uniref:hypothetical protein n=1 Tax=Pseudomonas leptonychotis TaxID=2448482 RepID=UPI00386E5A09
MSEEMQPIDPVTAAMLMGQVPDPCEPIIEISHKVLTRLMDVVEFGDQLERVEKDRLLAHLKDVLAADQPELWAMHSPGPGEVHPVISKEEAERQQSELLALCKKQFPEIAITVNVIPSPFSPLEHFEILAGELSEQVKHLQAYVKALEEAAKNKAVVLAAQENLHLEAINCPHSINEHEVVLRFDPSRPGHNALNQLARRLTAALKPAGADGDSVIDSLRNGGLTIDGDNAYKRDLLDAAVGSMLLGRQNSLQPPEGHWAQRFWDIGREYAALPGAIVLPMPDMPDEPVGAIDDSWMDGYNAALRMREQCMRAIDAAAGNASNIAMPAGLHPDTQYLVTRFATALAVKLHAAELKHGYSDGWKEPNWMDECRQKLIEHLAKGDPRDVAAYCAFLWHHCQSTSPKSCLWTYDADSFIWNSACGNTWSFIDEGPEENHMHFCNRCGGSLVVEKQEEALPESDEAEPKP